MKGSLKFIFPLILMLLSCSSDDEPSVSGEWAIDQNLVRDGGVGRDGIPSVDQPDFTLASEVDYLDDEDLILGIRIGDVIKGYPHPILDWHEIVNDGIDDQKYALTYCPLTGTGIGWDRIINDSETTFGVSGLLFESNLMPYDRASESIWSQQRLDCVNGENIGQQAQLFTFVETSWETWRFAYPNSLVQNENTGANRNYDRYPYGSYRTDDDARISATTINDPRLPGKQRVLGVRVNDVFKVYPFDTTTFKLVVDTMMTDTMLIDSMMTDTMMTDTMTMDTVITDTLSSYRVNLSSDIHGGDNLLIVSSNELNLLVAFRVPEGEQFTVLPKSEFPFLFKDGSNNNYDLFGWSESGPLSTVELSEQFIGYWFSWGAFYENVEIFER